ncbi:hypothetical protein ABID08_004804 [Rhizobium binae]|uniref:Uncharacterized protein n=1 Tax=Rhizobium binae TaxID=1138190 RepID=A0ABV2MPX3_9HYPH|nr:hypothetical protein [Rhizobium binae]MBX4949710.1 hypothetical protein [Rhizobium binae]MBX4966816.1 hypothetical protein [Rhizobium binae]MBX4994390.1 hypothetical protein [Rhizobium binae]QSY84526.1 hypothetical protein J2J99_23315 [Rhizobium binae]
MKSRIKPFIVQIRKRRSSGAKDAAKALLSKPAGKLPTASAVLEART